VNHDQYLSVLKPDVIKELAEADLPRSQKPVLGMATCAPE
jgi:hypothetical protein